MNDQNKISGSKDYGFIPLNRKIFNHFLWDEKREFSRFEAWLDMIATAQYRVEPFKQLIKGKMLLVKRGQLRASLSFLQQRWGWKGRKRVMTFLNILEKEEMIKRETDKETRETIITICNYDYYNPTNFERKQQYDNSGKHRGNTDSTDDDTQTNNVNKENTVKESESSCSPTESIIWIKEWIIKKAPSINKMSEPFTDNQILEIQKFLPGEKGKEVFMHIVTNMNNWKGIEKSRSAYGTFRKWLKIEKDESVLEKIRWCERAREKSKLMVIEDGSLMPNNVTNGFN
jgi:hypothetical protein